MASNITKDFERKSLLRKLNAEEYEQAKRPLGEGSASRAASSLYGRDNRIERAVDDAQRDTAERASPLRDEPASRKAPADFRFADGGSIAQELVLRNSGLLGNAARALSGRGRQIDDAVDAAQQPPQPSVQPAPAQQPSPLRQQDTAQQLGLDLNTNVQSRAEDAVESARRALAGLADGGRVKGAGGRTEDKVGPVMLSDQEYVLPADTADAIGRDKLDAIRMQTHDFKDKGKESALRAQMNIDKLADGGSPFDRLRTGMQQGYGAVKTFAQQGAAAAEPYVAAAREGLNTVRQNVDRYNANKAADAATARQAAANSFEGAELRKMTAGNNAQMTAARNAMAQAAADKRAFEAQAQARVNPQPAAAPAATSAPSRFGRVGSALRSGAADFLKGGAAIGGVLGAAQANSDNVRGGPVDQLIADNAGPGEAAGVRLANAVNRVADGALFGLPSRIGRGLYEGAVGNKGFFSDFADGFSRGNVVDEIAANQTANQSSPSAAAPAPAGVAPATASAQPASANTQSLAQQSTPTVPVRAAEAAPAQQGWVNLGTLGGDSNIYRRGNSYTNIPVTSTSQLRERAAQINREYDNLLGSQTADWRARHGASVLRDRNAALNSVYGNLTQARGQTINAAEREAALNQQAEQARDASALRQSADRADRELKARTAALNAQLGLVDRAEKREERQYQHARQNAESFDKAIGSYFLDAEGKPDNAKANFARQFIGMAGGTYKGKPIEDLNKQEQGEMMARFLPEINKAWRANQQGQGVHTGPVDVTGRIAGGPTGGYGVYDLLSGTTGPVNYLRSKFDPRAAADVLQLSDGRRILREDLTTDEHGRKDLDAIKSLGRQSALR